MEKILKKLEELGIGEEDLPKELQSDIDELDAQSEALNVKMDYLEKKGLSQDEIDEAVGEDDTNIELVQDDIIERIESFYENTRGNDGNGQKKGYGWLLLGGVVLVLTLGAVNVMQKN